MSSVYKNWFVHNVFAHPIMELLKCVGMVKLGNKLHDSTLPLEFNKGE